MRKTQFSSTTSANSLLQQVITGSQTSGCTSREARGGGIEAAAVHEIIWGYNHVIRLLKCSREVGSH